MGKCHKKAREYLFMLIPFITRKWGPNPMYLRWVYTAIIRSRIMYAFIIWGHSNIYGSKMNELHKINKLACKLLTPVRHTTPRKSLEVIYDLIPLDLYGTYEAIVALTRQEHTLTQTWIGYNPKYKTYTGHRHHWHETRNNLIARCILTDREKGNLETMMYTIDEKSLTNKTPPDPHTDKYIHGRKQNL